MFKFFNKLGAGARYAACTVAAAFMAGATSAFAQTDQGSQILGEVSDTMSGLVGDIIQVVQILLAIAAIVSLFVVIYNIWKQERDAAQKAIWWVVGFAVGWSALYIIGNIVESAAG